MNCTSRPQGSRATLKALTRPLRLLVTSPIIFALAFEVAVVYGIQYLIFTTLSYVFQDEYKFSTGESGLTFLGNGIGCLLGILSTTSLSLYVSRI